MVVAVIVLVVAGAGPAGAGGNGRAAGPGAADGPRRHAAAPSDRGGHAHRGPARASRSATPPRRAPAAHRPDRSQRPERPRGVQSTPGGQRRGPGEQGHAAGKGGGKGGGDDGRVRVLSTSATPPTPVAAPAPVSAPSRPGPASAPAVAAPAVPPRVGPQQLVGPLAPVVAQLDPPMLASPTFVERIVERFPDIPTLPARPSLIDDPAFPLALVALLGLFLAITGRGDRRDPKLTKAELDARGREIGFS